jgi:hypothetical protein
MSPFDDLFYRNNASVLYHVGRAELMVLLAIFFAAISLVTWRIKGRGISYFVSQFLSIACVILAVAFLFEKVTAWRVTQHMLAEHHLAESQYPQLFR